MSHRLPSSIRALLLSAALTPVMLTGCSQTTHTSARSDAPIAYQPEGALQAQGLPAAQLPPPINVSGPGNIARTTITPTIIDTDALAVQRQITEPFDGNPRMIKHVLPKHSRDKSLKETPNNRPLPVGRPVKMDRINAGIGTGFTGIAQTEWSPPDPTLAVGPNHIVETVNAAIAFYDKQGNQTYSAHLGTPGNPGFFEEVGASSNFVFDPKCFYDHKSGRFVVMALETIGDTESWIDIAISDDSDPNGIWYKYRTFSVIQVETSELSDYWVDYPGFGFDDHAFYVTGNLFLLSGDGDGFAGQLFRIFDKSPMLDGQPVTFIDYAPNTGASLQVAQMFGPAPQCVFVSRWSDTSLRFWTLNDPLGTPEFRSKIVGGLAPASGPSQGAPNLGGGDISTLDGRLMNVQVRNGNLYTAHGVNGDDGFTTARWYHFALNDFINGGPLDPTLIQQGQMEDGQLGHYFFPAIYSDTRNNVGLIAARSSTDSYASVRVSGRVPSDPPGTISEPIELAIGDNTANGRWGDYLDIAIDPNDDTTFWIVGMYQKNFGWQTWIDSFSIVTQCEADLSGDGELDFLDISAFLSAYQSGNLNADFNGDKQLDFIDVSLFLSLYSAGCP